MDKLFDLSGRTALVTGSSRGIGRAIALGLADAGCNVIIHSVGSSRKADEAVQEVMNKGRKSYKPRFV